MPSNWLKLHLCFAFVSPLVALQLHQLFVFFLPFFFSLSRSPILLQSHMVLFRGKSKADSLRKSDVLALIALAKEWIMQ